MQVIPGIIASSYPAVINSYEYIATVTVGAGGSSSISFTSIPSTYKHLQIRGIARCDIAGTYQQLQGRINGDTGNNYSAHALTGDGSSTGTLAYSSISVFVAGQAVGSTGLANDFSATVLDILDYSNTNKYKTLRSLSGQDQNGSGFAFFASSSWQNTAAITSVTLFPSTSNNFVQYSQFALYGVKG